MKRGLTELEKDQMPAIIEPLLSQLNMANNELNGLKTKLKEKATLVDMDKLRSEVEEKASNVVHE